MTQDQIKTNIMTVINTLNTVEVKGRDNMNRLLGSIVHLENTVKLIDQLQEEIPHEEHQTD